MVKYFQQKHNILQVIDCFSQFGANNTTLNTESLLGHVAKADVMTSGSPSVKLAFKVKVVDMETEVTKIGEC